MIGAVKIFDFPGGDELLLYVSKGSRRTAAYHEGASVDVFIRDDVLFSQRIVFIGNKVDTGIKEFVDVDSRNMFSLFYKCKEDVGPPPWDREERREKCGSKQLCLHRLSDLSLCDHAGGVDALREGGVFLVGERRAESRSDAFEQGSCLHGLLFVCLARMESERQGCVCLCRIENER